MTTHNHRPILRNFAIAAGLVLAGGTAFAADLPTIPELHELIVVIPSPVHRTVVGRADNGGPIEELSLSRVVTYGDLDLNALRDFLTLNARVADAARLACRELAEARPLAHVDEFACARDAAHNARKQVRDATVNAG